MFARPFALMSIFTRCTLYTLLLALYTSMWIRGGTNKNKPASQSPSSLPLPHMCTYVYTVSVVNSGSGGGGMCIMKGG